MGLQLWFVCVCVCVCVFNRYDSFFLPLYVFVYTYIHSAFFGFIRAWSGIFHEPNYVYFPLSLPDFLEVCSFRRNFCCRCYNSSCRPPLPRGAARRALHLALAITDQSRPLALFQSSFPSAYFFSQKFSPGSRHSIVSHSGTNDVAPKGELYCESEPEDALEMSRTLVVAMTELVPVHAHTGDTRTNIYTYVRMEKC